MEDFKLKPFSSPEAALASVFYVQNKNIKMASGAAVYVNLVAIYAFMRASSLNRHNLTYLDAITIFLHPLQLPRERSAVCT